MKIHDIGRGIKHVTRVLILNIVLMAILGAPLFAAEEQSAAELAKKVQNPVADLISVPFQNNFNFGVGPEDALQYDLNIEPVFPFRVSEGYKLITRTVVPIISQPGFTPTEDRTTGLGDIQFSAFLSPEKSEGLTWGVGPTVQLPTNSNDRLGNDRWGLGASVVALKKSKGSPWLVGALVNNVWSVSGSDSDPSYSNFLIRPFINYNFTGGFYLSSDPEIIADWKADSGNRWTIPLGGGVGQIVRLGRLPVNVQLEAFYNVAKPDNGADWQLRFQFQLLFPK